MKMIGRLSNPRFQEYLLLFVHSTSVTPLSPHTHSCFSRIFSKAILERVWRDTWRPRSSELRDALGHCVCSGLDMCSEAVIERVW
jgi:hypothetical protein